MTVPTQPALKSDAELLNRVREGDSEAYGVLYRRHADAARRFATVLARDGGEAEDLAAEAFARVLASLRGGRGPQTAFRPYLLTAVRNAFYDRVRRTSRVEPTDTIEDYEKPEPYEDPSIAALERSYAARAFARLPERWRAVLWHTEVEGETPTQIAPLFGLSANAVAVLAFRARERLKQGYLAEHITLTGSPRCHWTGEHLPGYVRANLAGRDRVKVEDHLAECAECRRLHRELSDANVSLRVVLAPLLLGVAAPRYLAYATSGGGLGAVWTALAGLIAAWWEAARTGWWWLTTLPRRLARRYGAANVAAATGLVVAACVGVAMFAVAAVIFPAGPRTQHTDAAGIPIPAPAQTGYSTPDVSMPPLAPITPAAASTTAEAPPPTAAAKTPASAAEAVAVRPDTAGSGLVAGGVSRIPLAFSRAESATVDRTEAAVLSAFRAPHRKVAQQKGWEFGIDLPPGFRLAGSDAGDRWTCRGTSKTVKCRRPDLMAASTARVPVAIDAGATGYQAITIRLPRRTKTFRIPVAPAGMRVAYSGIGRLAVAIGGNALLSCLPRPACLSHDNNGLTMLPLLPLPTEPGPPDGLFAEGGPTIPTGQLPELAGPKAASGALVAIPAKAKVRWAGLTVTASGATIPDLVVLHGQDAGWFPIRLTGIAKARSTGVRFQQAYADVTSYVRADGGGFWWVASAAGQLPGGAGQYAGWSLTVVYETSSAPLTEVAAYAGPVALEGTAKVKINVPGGSAITTAVTVWDGDRVLEGDRLTIGGRPVGTAANFAKGDSPSATALVCATHADGCVWRTPGVDIAQYAGRTAADSTVAVEPGHDPLGVGLLAVAQTPSR